MSKSDLVEQMARHIAGADAGPDDWRDYVCAARRAIEFIVKELWEPSEEMMQAMNDEVDRQRVEHGWPQYPKPPFSEWPEEEKAAARAMFSAAMRAWAEANGVKTPEE